MPLITPKYDLNYKDLMQKEYCHSAEICEVSFIIESLAKITLKVCSLELYIAIKIYFLAVALSWSSSFPLQPFPVLS